MSRQTVLVTGATGYVAGFVIKQLLEQGCYDVRGTVRSLANQKKVEHLTQMEGAKERLTFVEANFNDEGSFDEGCKGADYVLHIASPFIISAADPLHDVVEPAVAGTLSVLGSALSSGTVKRVVLTSSIAAVGDEGVRNGVHDENDWNESANLKHHAYPLSKVRAEKAAWKFIQEEASESNMSLVTINPGLIYGPLLNAGTLSESMGVMKTLVGREYPMVPDLYMQPVDVRDVAAAHILAMEKPDAEGRYLLVERTLSYKEVCQKMNKYVTGKKLPTRVMYNALVYGAALFEKRLSWQYLKESLGNRRVYKNDKSRALGVQYHDVEDSLKEVVECLYRYGFVTPK